jgi:hypothetical protein
MIIGSIQPHFQWFQLQMTDHHSALLKLEDQLQGCHARVLPAALRGVKTAGARVLHLNKG